MEKEQGMRRTRSGKRKRKDVITWSKLLTGEEQKKFMGYVKSKSGTLAGKRRMVICELLLHTGLRAEELCSLRIKDTPGVLGVLSVEVYRGKGDKDRTIPISRRLAMMISGYSEQARGKTMPKYIKRSDINRPVFYSQQRKPYTPNSLYILIRRAGSQAGIAKHLHPHMFRHTFATNALANGVDIRTVQYLMGHSDVKVTEKYLHLIGAQIEGLGEQLDPEL